MAMVGMAGRARHSWDAKELRMSAYVIVDVDVQDPELYRKYTALVPATLEPFGGRFIVRGGEHDVLEGDWRPRRLVVLEFPSSDHARRWHTSADYAAAMGIRHRASDGNLVLVEGAD
jgi:uncharacterized protein (DUF1330 family)